MSVPSDIQTSQAKAHDHAHLWADHGSDFVLIAEGKPPSRVVPRQSKINNLNCQTDLTAAMGAKGIFLHCKI
jgi:hypothetical protein